MKQTLLIGPPVGPPGGPAGFPPGSPPTGGPPCWAIECVPIDSGEIFLILAGIALGIWVIVKNRNKEK